MPIQTTFGMSVIKFPTENELLDAPFTDDEIKEAVFGLYANGAPSPDDVPFLFCQKFWESNQTPWIR